MSSPSTGERIERDAGPRLLKDIIFARIPPRLRDWALMLLTGLLATAIKGYNYGFNDQAVELPFVKYFMNPALYPGDMLFDSGATKQPFLWRLMAFLGESVPLPALTLALHVLASALTILAVWALAANLFRNRRSANLCLVVVALSVPMEYFPGLDPLRVVWPELVQRSFVFPWLLFALILALNRKLLPALVLAGLSFNIHPMSAGVTGLMIFFGALADPRARRKLPLAAVAGLVSALPILIGVALKPGAAAGTAANHEEWMMLLRLRMGHHLFPSTWELTRWLGCLLILAIGLRALLAMDLSQARYRTALVWFVVPVALIVPGYLFTEVWPVPVLILGQLFRGVKLAMMVGLFFVAHHQVLRIATGSPLQITVALAALAVTPALWAAGLIPAAVLAAPHLIASGPGEADPRRAGPALPVALVALLLVMAVGSVLAIRQRANASYTNWWGGVSPAWHGAQVWVKEHTPIDTTVLVPPETTGFRFFSERPIVGSLKDGGPHENNAANMIEWWERMEALGCEVAEGEKGRYIRCGDFTDLPADRLARVARRYDADLLVTYRRHDLPWTVLYRNDGWAVYDLPGGDDAADGGPGGARGE